MDLNFRITSDFKYNLIRVDFQRKVDSIGFTLQKAIEFRDIWNKHIEVLLERQHGGNGEKEKRS